MYYYANYIFITQDQMLICGLVVICDDDLWQNSSVPMVGTLSHISDERTCNGYSTYVDSKILDVTINTTNIQ